MGGVVRKRMPSTQGEDEGVERRDGFGKLARRRRLQPYEGGGKSSFRLQNWVEGKNQEESCGIGERYHVQKGGRAVKKKVLPVSGSGLSALWNPERQKSEAQGTKKGVAKPENATLGGPSPAIETGKRWNNEAKLERFYQGRKMRKPHMGSKVQQW